MTRLFRFLLRNWPLKVAAVLVAVLLYGALVISSNAQVWRGRIAITPLRAPISAVILGTLPDVTTIHYFAPGDVAARLSTSSFTATIDLSNAQVTTESPYVTAKVEVVASDPRVQILDFEPQSVRVQLDPLTSKELPVTVERGSVPPGLTVGQPELSTSTVTISGPESVVRLAAAVEARVIVQPSGIDIDQEVDLVVVNAGGDVLSPVDVSPASVHVKLRVISQLRSKTLPVDPSVVGTPAAGWEVESAEVTPAVVTVDGEADALATLVRLATAAVPITGASGGVVKTVGLVAPVGVAPVGVGSVRVVVHLRQVTGTRTFGAGIVLVGARSDRAYSLSTDSVSLTLGGSVESLGSLDGTTLVTSADVSALPLGTNEVTLAFVPPSGISVVAIQPVRVTVTVTQPR